MRIRSLLRALSVALLAMGLSITLSSPAMARPFPDRIDLPNGFFPEGIAIGRGGTAYLSSLANGDILAVNLRTGESSLVSPGSGELSSVGLKLDNRGRLFVAGGTTGTGGVIDVRTGAVLETYNFATAPTFINDVVLTKRYAWFTDSQQPVLYGVPLGPGGKLGSPADVVTLPLSGEWQQIAGATNANGIAETPDRQALLVVNSASGVLVRVDLDTGMATAVNLGGFQLTSGDGLLVRGTTLYVVQNFLNQVAVIKLDAAGTSGRFVETLSSDDFDIPTTVAAFGNSLYLPNARFTTPPGAGTQYWITRIDRR